MIQKLSIKILGILISCLILPFNSAVADILIVVHTTNTDTSVYRENLKRIFLGKKTRWTDGSKIHPAIYKEGTLHEKFVKLYINKTVYSYHSYWKMAIMTG